MPRVSIIPVYNTELHLRECLRYFSNGYAKKLLAKEAVVFYRQFPDEI